MLRAKGGFRLAAWPRSEGAYLARSQRCRLRRRASRRCDDASVCSHSPARMVSVRVACPSRVRTTSHRWSVQAGSTTRRRGGAAERSPGAGPSVHRERRGSVRRGASRAKLRWSSRWRPALSPRADAPARPRRARAPEVARSDIATSCGAVWPASCGRDSDATPRFPWNSSGWSTFLRKRDPRSSEAESAGGTSAAGRRLHAGLPACLLRRPESIFRRYGYGNVATVARNARSRGLAPGCIETRVLHQPVEPGGEPGVAAKARDAREQLQENLLRDVGRFRCVAVEEIETDRVHPVLICLVERTKGVPIAVAAGFENAGGDFAIGHAQLVLSLLNARG